MADKSITERLQPSLLDRLTDNAPGERTERREERVIDLRKLREIVQRDLSWLLNTSDNAKLFDAKRYPNVARSVLNYGIREVAGDYSTAERAEIIRRSIAEAIRDFEPRLHAGSVEVRMRNEVSSGTTLVSYDIVADMWAQPLPMELYLRSEVDVTTGQTDLKRMN